MRIAALLLALALPAKAQVTPEKVTELERKIEALSREMERIKLGEAAPEPIADVKQAGLAPAATKVYRAAEKKVSIGGYGEMIYQNFSKRRQNGSTAGTKDESDMLRAILYAGYKFNDWILFNSEIEFEHGSTKPGNAVAGSAPARGEVSVEMAYLDFKFHPNIGARAGLVLVPMGLTNEIHEPTTFHGVKRPSVESNIIPSTWRENAAGVFGEFGPVSFRSYVMSGLQAVNSTNVPGFSSSSGLRNGRSSGAKSFSEDLAWVARADYQPVEGVQAGGSFYVGKADQNLIAASVPVTLWEGHVRGEWRGAEVKALWAEGRIGNADSVNAFQGNTTAGGNSVGSKLFGGYAEGAFNVLSLCQTAHYLAPFYRYERYDTQLGVPAGWSKNAANSRVEHTVGLTYKPIPQVAIKADHQWLRNQARTGINQWNLGLGYIF
jgi:hypothetical protein